MSASGNARREGFTLVELLITITIVFMLIGMLVVQMGKSRVRARTEATSARISRIDLALSEYQATAGEYPADGLDGRRVETDEGTILESGAALTFALINPVRARKRQPDGNYKVLGEREPIGDFTQGELSKPVDGDPQAVELLDGFEEAFHYDRLSGGSKSFSQQDDADVHLTRDRIDEHHLDPREEAGGAVVTAGPQNPGSYDGWSHGVNGHIAEEKPEDVIGNWSKPTGGGEDE